MMGKKEGRAKTKSFSRHLCPVSVPKELRKNFPSIKFACTALWGGASQFIGSMVRTFNKSRKNEWPNFMRPGHKNGAKANKTCIDPPRKDSEVVDCRRIFALQDGIFWDVACI